MARRPDLGYFADGKDLLDPATYAEATASYGAAKTLPATAFRSLEFALLEDEAIWTRDWIAIGMTSDISSDGDIMPFTAGNHGIHVQRMADGTLEGRFNNAQHGGCRFVPVQCQGGTKTKCSFTSCGYSRDRDAIPAAEGGYGVPAMHQYLGLRPERRLRVSVAELHGMILVNVDGPDKNLSLDDAIPPHIEAAFAGKPDRTDKRWMEFDCNWKTLAVALAASDGMPLIMEGALASERVSASCERLSALWLFPNVVILSTEQASCVLVLQHTALERTLCRVYSLGARHSTAAAKLFDEIAVAAAKAIAAHKPLAHAAPADEAIQRDPVGYWMQTTLVRHLMTMPQQVHAAPMFQSTRHYAI